MAEPDKRTQGFTLVELMVVLVIIALAATAVVLAMPEPGGSVESEAVRFAARTNAARDRAILESRPAAVEVGRGGYEVARRVGGAWRTEARYDWVDGTTPEIAAAGSGSIRFDSIGLAEPAFVVLRRGGRSVTVEIGGDGDVHVRRP